MIRVRLTDHARLRAAEMGVRTKAVKRTLTEPDLIYPGGPGYPPGSRTALLDDLAVPFLIDQQDGTRVALTVLWRRAEQWNREQESV